MRNDDFQDDMPSSAIGSAKLAIDPGQLGQRLGYVLRRAQMAVFAVFFEAFTDYDIKPAQYSVLTIIGSNPGLSQTQVAKYLGIKKPNFVAMIKTLEDRGLIRRMAIRGDKRANALFLTETGEKLMTELHGLADEHEARLRKRIGNSEYESLYKPLQKLAEMQPE